MLGHIKTSFSTHRKFGSHLNIKGFPCPCNRYKASQIDPLRWKESKASHSN